MNKTRWFSYFLAFVVWSFCSFQIMWIFIDFARGKLKEKPMIGDLLTQSSFQDTIAPWAIVWLMAWVMFELLLHALRVRAEAASTLQFVAAVGGPEVGVDQRRFHSVKGNSRASRRAGYITGTSSWAGLLDALPGASALDAETVSGAYTYLRVYVWILPVVGFVGTALGMSHSIAGFSVALNENLPLDSLTLRLGQTVIPGLANAFSTTILALVAAVAGHFCASVLQAGDQRALDDLDAASLQFLARLPRTDVSGGTGASSLQALSESISLVANSVQNINKGVENMLHILPQVAQSLSSLSDQSKQLGQAMGDTAVWQRLHESVRRIHAVAVEMLEFEKRPLRVEISKTERD